MTAQEHAHHHDAVTLQSPLAESTQAAGSAETSPRGRSGAGQSQSEPPSRPKQLPPSSKSHGAVELLHMYGLPQTVRERSYDSGLDALSRTLLHRPGAKRMPWSAQRSCKQAQSESAEASRLFEKWTEVLTGPGHGSASGP